MANVRIKDLTTTAATTASDDFFGVDGATNGTRKLNAYSPTFGGNLTVSGTGTFADNLIISTTAKGLVWGSSISSITGNTTTGVLTVSQPGNTAFTISNGAMTGTSAMFELKTPSADVPIAMRFTPASSKYAWQIAAQTNVSNAFEITPSTAAGGTTFSTPALTVGLTSTTVAGNLTVSGGTITGGTSGMSLAAGGTNQNITLTPSGTGSVALSSTGANVLTIFRDTVDNNLGTAIKFRQKDVAGTTVDLTDIYAYKSVGTAGSVSSWLAIATRNAGTLTEAMYIAPSGNVVLGSTATDGGQKLQVNGTAIVSSTTDITQGNLTTGALYVAGGATIAKSMQIGGGTITTYSTTGSASNQIVSTVTSDAGAYTTFTRNTTGSARDWWVGTGHSSIGADFGIRDHTNATVALRLANGTGDATLRGSVTTAAPSGGTAGAWKLGVRVAATTTLDTTQYLQVDVGGTLYKVALVTS